jgi:hypothetical protein
MRLFILSTVLILVAFGPAPDAGGAVVGLFNDLQATEPVIHDAGPGLKSIYAFVILTPGATATQFSAPVPACFKGATWLADQAPFPVTIGNSQTGVAIGFGSCLASPIHVLTINVFAQGLTDSCCFYQVLPDPNVPSGEVEVVDCNAVLIPATGMTSIVSPHGGGFPPLIGDPDPPTGAVEQPVDRDVNWTFETCSIGLGVVWTDVYFGTTPDPPLVSQMDGGLTYDPGQLEAATTYFWKIRVVDTDAGATESPVWNFTTIQTVASEHTPWGRVKALFR